MNTTKQKRNGELLRALFQVLIDNPDGVQGKDAIAAVKQKVELLDSEKGVYSNNQPKFDKLLRFATIDCMKAGWMLKQKGTWTITDEGVEAFQQFKDPEKFAKRARWFYKKWKSEARPDGSDAKEREETSINFEQAEELAWDEVRKHLQSMNPYDFQDMVADLLRAIGYHSTWVAPPGKDGGVDIIAYDDVLGATTPRLKVQVKRTKTSISVEGLRSFLAVLGDDDVGIFVCTGGFTRDARQEARTQEKRRITLIDMQKLYDLWIEHYANLEESAKRRLPLKPIYFLAPD